MSVDEPDPYVVLGVSPGVSREELKRRYRELAKKWHPDRRRGDPDADRQMKLINAAYRLLSTTGADPRAAREWAEREARQRDAREQAARERDARERAAQDRAARERAARERAARERAERERSEWEARERERAEQEARVRAERERAEREPSRFASVTFSDRTTFHPVGLVFPRGREAYTIRIRVDEDDDDDIIFLTRGRRLMLFRTPASMAGFLSTDTRHDLTRLPAWGDVRRSMATTSLEPEVDDYCDFDFVMRALGRPREQWVPRAFVGCRDMVFEIAKAFRRRRLLEIVAPGSPIDRLDDLMRVVDEPFAGWGARRNLRRLSANFLSMHWRLAVGEIRKMAYWYD